MADNFDMKKFLVENKLGAYSRLKEDLGKDIEDAEAEKDMDFLAEYEVIYRWEGSKCFRITDEGYKDEVNPSYCKRFANESKEKEEEQFGGINEGSADEVPLTPKVKKFIDKAIADAKKDGEFENLVDADWFDNELIDELIDLFEDEDYDSASKEVKDYISKAISVKESQMNEALEPHVYERMYNLSNIKAQQAMIKAAEILMNDLTAEGFEVPEIREFFTQLIANDI